MSVACFRSPDGVELAADVAGDLAGPTVVLLHGGGQTRHSWAGAMRALVAAGYAVVNLDGRGHGDSGWSATGDYALPARGADLAAVAAEIGGPLALVGASMGGGTAIWGVTHGLPARAIVLVDIVPRADEAGVRRVVDFMAANLDGFPSLEAAAAAVSAYNPHRPPSTDTRGLAKNLRLRDGRYYWHWDPKMLDRGHADELAGIEACLDALGRLDALPTLLVRGGSSDVVTDAGVAHLRDIVPHLEVAEVAGAGHMVAGDRNDPFNAAIVAFLRRHMPAG